MRRRVSHYLWSTLWEFTIKWSDLLPTNIETYIVKLYLYTSVLSRVFIHMTCNNVLLL